jgi:ketosteroid isomerase-like protein
MTITLNGAVAAFFEAERADDLEALARCFGERATVRDEGRVIQGADAIKRWMKDAKAKYHHTAEPIAVSHHDGMTVVTARVAGAFPNSPLDLEHVFVVEGGRIASLEIR